MAEELSKLKIEKGKGPSARRRPGRWIFAALATAAVAAAGFALGGKPVEVETATVTQVYPSQAFTLLNASGYVVAQRKASVASKTTGRLEWLGVEEGSHVTAGQVLARLENRDAVEAKLQLEANLSVARASLEQARAELDDATLSYDRQKALISEGIVSRAEHDTAEARFRRAKAATEGARSGIRAAEAALRGGEVSLDYSYIRAPFDAVVLTKNADIGDIITPLGAAANAKAAVVTIADLGSLEVEADVSESNLGKVRVGQPCEIQLDALPDARFRGSVHTVVPTADRTKASVLVKVRFLEQDPRILPEMSAKVAFLEREARRGEERPRIAVPAAALVTRDGAKRAYVVKGDRVAETVVATGAPVGDLVEVASGLRPGDKVVTKPAERLKDGAKIRTAERK
jgi:RND family efflux transporter MFP subunit